MFFGVFAFLFLCFLLLSLHFLCFFASPRYSSASPSFLSLFLL